jgi:hypothetical protein
MKPLRDWNILWFVGLNIVLLGVVLFGQIAVCSAFGCVIPAWLPKWERLVISIVTAGLAIPALIRMFRKNKERKSSAKPWWADR